MMTGVALLLSLVALAVAVLALLYAWRLHKEVERAAARLDRYNRALFEAGEELRRLRTLAGPVESTGPASSPDRRPNITLDV